MVQKRNRFHLACFELAKFFKSMPTVMLVSVLVNVNSIAAQPLDITFNHPANDWESESLPIGNGALGANVMGGINLDELQFAEKSLWTGGPNSKQGYDFGLPAKSENYPQKLAQIQQALQQNGELKPEAVAEVLGRNYTGYGSYQNFASVKMTFAHDINAVHNYQRTLNLDSAIATVSYQINGVTFYREYFVSYPNQAIVVRLSADKPAQINVGLSLITDKNRTVNTTLGPKAIGINGELLDNELQYAASLDFHQKNGVVNRTAEGVSIEHADSVWFTVVANTNYANAYPLYRGDNAVSKVKLAQSGLASLSYAELKQAHLDDYQTLYSRVNFALNQQSTRLTTPELLRGYHTTNVPQDDRLLEVLYYQYGRYLLISSSRVGSLPANLQGVWNKYEQAPWSADYHVNINLQMNYWLADMTNLAETLPPLFDFIQGLQAPGQQTAQTLFNAKGWTLLLNTNIWGFTGLIAWPTAFWQPEGAAWMARHFYEHYLFSQDQTFLSQQAYPVMLGASEFWLDTLQRDNNNQWLVSPSYSPEHGDFTVGAAMSQQIVFDLLSNTSQVAGVLGDAKTKARIDKTLAQLNAGLKIGSWGQLQEWQADLDDKTSKHRHVSHLYALHPGQQISPLTTPDLAQAARVTLDARGDEGTGWSKAWKINFWARLLDGDRAHKLLGEQLLHSTLSNLWDNHPPFQIDGNFGATAGITEMLLQSQNDEIHLLPALPTAWPNGQISGLKARGNIEVDIAWSKGLLTAARLKSQDSRIIKVRVSPSANSIKVTGMDGRNIVLNKFKSGFSFTAKGGVNYHILVGSNPQN